jgi:hypothetical protein
MTQMTPFSTLLSVFFLAKPVSVGFLAGHKHYTQDSSEHPNQKQVNFLTLLCTHMCFYHFFGIMDSVLIAMMAYDQFVAICHLLHDPTPLWPAGWWPMGVFLLHLPHLHPPDCMSGFQP